MKYTDLIFDLYGTLIDIHTNEDDNIWEKTALYFGFYGADYNGITLKKKFNILIEKYKAESTKNYECYPEIPFEKIMSELFQSKGIENNVNELGTNAAQLFRILSIEYIKLYPHVLEALSTLRKKGYRLWLLSNAQRVFTEYELRYLGLSDLFDGIYISSDYGYRKPDKHFFQILINEQKLDSTKCLMIGNDLETDIAGAKIMGIDTLYMHTNLTPENQRIANSSTFSFKKNIKDCHYEYEGSDWKQLLDLICKL